MEKYPVIKTGNGESAYDYDIIINYNIMNSVRLYDYRSYYIRPIQFNVFVSIDNNGQ